MITNIKVIGKEKFSILVQLEVDKSFVQDRRHSFDSSGHGWIEVESSSLYETNPIITFLNAQAETRDILSRMRFSENGENVWEHAALDHPIWFDAGDDDISYLILHAFNQGYNKAKFDLQKTNEY